MEEKLLKAKEVMEILSISKTKLYRMIKQGYLKRVIISSPEAKKNRIRFKLSEVNKLIENLPTK